MYLSSNPASIYLFKINNENTRRRCEILLKLTIKISEDVIDFVPLSLLLALNICHNFFCCFYCWLWVGEFLLGSCNPANIYLFKLAGQTLEKGVNMFKVNTKNTRTRSMTPFEWFCCFYILLWTYFTYFSNVSIVEFRQVNVGREHFLLPLCNVSINTMKSSLW